VIGFSVLRKRNTFWVTFLFFVRCLLECSCWLLILVETTPKKQRLLLANKSDIGSFFLEVNSCRRTEKKKNCAIFNFLDANYPASLWITRNCLHFNQWISDNHANSDLKVIHLWYCYNPILFILFLVCSIQYF